jgi:hypothetical protein
MDEELIEKDVVKIVINKCYGGFGLSYEAMMLWAKLKKMKLYAYVSVAEYKDGPHESRDWDRYVPYRPGGDAFCIHYSTRPLAKTGKISEKGYVSEHDIPRNDPALVKVVQRLKSKADGRCAELGIVEIPTGVDYEIDEYDGIETVHEKHRSWG